MKLEKQQKFKFPTKNVEILPDKTSGIAILNNNMNTALQEATEDKLSAREKAKLAKFMEKTDDIEEIKTFISGLKNATKINEEWAGEELYSQLPQDVQAYLDEIDGPWVEYGISDDGTIFYSDDYDTYVWNTLDEFIADQRYNMQQNKL